MTLTEILVAIHIVGAAFWVGGNFIMNVWSWRLSKSGTQEHALWFLGVAEWTGFRVFMPLSLIVLGAGAWLVEEAGWSFDKLFVQLGLFGFALTFVGGAAVISPLLKKTIAIVSEHGYDSVEAKASIKRLELISRVDLLILFLVVLNMTLKPGN